MRLSVDSDVIVYVASGVLCVAIFVAALVLVSSTASIGFETREFVGLIVGFSVFIAVYFVSMWLYRTLSR